MREIFDAPSVLEQSATYNVAVLQDDLVKITLRALTFAPNLNNFQFKYPVLQRLHTNAFGQTIPAYKSFERQLVNRNHNMTDANPRVLNEPIGYVESSELREDGVYLTCWIWKRTLSESELAEIRRGTAKVSMECEYTHPVVRLSDGSEKSLTPGQAVPLGAVRTIADDSVVSFIGLGVLFDGINPADPYSGVIHVENAMVESAIVISDECKDFAATEGEKMDNDLQAQLAALQEELAALKSAKDQAELALTEKAEAEKSKAEELAALQSQLAAAQAEVATARRQVFNKNLSSVMDTAAIPAEMLDWVLKLFTDAVGDGQEEAQFHELSAKLKTVSAALKRKKACGSTETATEEPAPATPEEAAATTQEVIAVQEGACLGAAPKTETTFTIFDL